MNFRRQIGNSQCIQGSHRRIARKRSLQAAAGSAKLHPSVDTARRVIPGPQIERLCVMALISVKKPFVDNGYESLDSANSVEFFTMIGVSVCNRPARAEKS